jgi:ankyrin repeat protein
MIYFPFESKYILTADRRQINDGDESAMTSVHWAAYCGHLQLLRYLVGRGCVLGSRHFWELLLSSVDGHTHSLIQFVVILLAHKRT